MLCYNAVLNVVARLITVQILGIEKKNLPRTFCLLFLCVQIASCYVQSVVYLVLNTNKPVPMAITFFEEPDVMFCTMHPNLSFQRLRPLFYYFLYQRSVKYEHPQSEVLGSILSGSNESKYIDRQR